MRFIPEYYPIPAEDFKRSLTTEELETLRNASEACNLYTTAVIEAVEKARNQFIEPYTKKNVLYSRTWGK